MNALRAFFSNLFAARSSVYDQDEAYLSQATDIYDLEHRQRQLDTRRRDDGWFSMAGGAR